MKIPVGKTLEAAFSFTFRNFFSVLGTVWFPLLIAVVLVVGLAVFSFTGVQGEFQSETFDRAALMQLLPRFAGVMVWFWFVIIIAGAMIQVGLLRKALGLHPAPVFIFFSLGPDVWRMIGALFLVALISIGLALGFVVAGFVVYGIAHVAIGEPGSYWLAGWAAFVLWCAFIYSMVRLTYFVPVIVVAEQHIGLSRAWDLGRGNFWRILAITIVLSLAVNIVAGMIQSTFAPPFAMTMGQPIPPAEFLKTYMTYMRSMGPLIGIVTILQMIFLYGLMAGAAANAYRAVTAPPEGIQPA
jgi:hypothetical protein